MIMAVAAHGSQTTVFKPRVSRPHVSSLWVCTLLLTLVALAGCTSDKPEGAAPVDASPDPTAAASSGDGATTSTESLDELDLTELVSEERQPTSPDPDGSDGSSADADEPVGQPQTQAAAEAAAFSACMRDNGIAFPDLELNEDGTVSISTLLDRIDREDRLVESGLAQCQDELGESFTDQLTLLFQNQILEDGLANFSNCIRDAGYDVGDLTVPDLVTGALGLSDADAASTDRLLATGLGLDPNNPSDLAVVDDCDEIVARAISDLDLGG